MAVIFVNLNIDSNPMRYLIILFAVAISFFSCVKQKPKNPFPEIEFKEFMAPQNSRDTGAKILIGYSDGDGDLFVDQLSEGPNIFITSYSLNPVSKQFEAPFSTELNDTIRYTNTIRQPDNGYYKGKAIKGDILVPMNQYRPNSKARIIKFTGFVQDLKQNKSNLFSSPVYTINW